MARTATQRRNGRSAVGSWAAVRPRSANASAGRHLLAGLALRGATHPRLRASLSSWAQVSSSRPRLSASTSSFRSASSSVSSISLKNSATLPGSGWSVSCIAIATAGMPLARAGGRGEPAGGQACTACLHATSAGDGVEVVGSYCLKCTLWQPPEMSPLAWVGRNSFRDRTLQTAVLWHCLHLEGEEAFLPSSPHVSPVCLSRTALFSCRCDAVSVAAVDVVIAVPPTPCCVAVATTV